MKKRHSAEQIVAKLREADVELGKGQRVPEVCKQLNISEQTYYRWRTKYGGMDPQMAKQLKAEIRVDGVDCSDRNSRGPSETALACPPWEKKAKPRGGVSDSL